MAHERNLDNMSLDGGWLCLDFINTVHNRFVDDPHDYLKSCEDLLLWGVKTNILDYKEATALNKAAGKDSAGQEKVLQKAKSIRDTLYRLFRPIAGNRVPARRTISEFNGYLSAALSGLSVHFNSPHVVYPRQKNSADLENPLRHVLTSAYDLLLSGNLDRVKECGECGWLFLDKSKNNSKRWCNMQTCGSSVKAKRYYRKKKNGGL